MDAAIAAFSALVAYEVGEVTAAATYYMAEVYSNFGRSLAESERPAGLAAAQLQDYELALEEEAFPFEERSISVHEKNLELIGARHLQRVDRQEPRTSRGAQARDATRSTRSAADSWARSIATCIDSRSDRWS